MFPHTRGLVVVAQLCVGLILAALTARAHDPGLSTLQGRWTADGLQLTAGFSFKDARQLLPATSDAITSTNFDQFRSPLAAAASDAWSGTMDGHATAAKLLQVRLLPGDNVEFDLLLPRPTGEDTLKLQFRKLAMLPRGHRQFASIADASGKPIVQKLLSADDDSVTVPSPQAEPTAVQSPPTFLGFIRLGVGHIWTGYDHLLFLFGLLIVCRTFRSIVKIISCFTLAHSLTLALATLRIVNLPSGLTEPAIAASIVFVGVENLLRRGAEPRARWLVTFAFGLIHGFGFASVLRDLGVGSGGEGIAVPLFTFNLGVELGQIAIAGLALPIVWRLRQSERFVGRGIPALSATVAMAGMYWFIERTCFA